MAKREITVCDRCGVDAPCKSFFIVTGRQSDPAGSMDDVGTEVDLCFKCLSNWFLRSITGRDYAVNYETLKWAKGGKEIGKR